MKISWNSLLDGISISYGEIFRRPMINDWRLFNNWRVTGYLENVGNSSPPNLLHLLHELILTLCFYFFYLLKEISLVCLLNVSPVFFCLHYFLFLTWCISGTSLSISDCMLFSLREIVLTTSTHDMHSINW